MAKKKTFKELTLKDNFLFGAVMMDEENFTHIIRQPVVIDIIRIKNSIR